MQVAVRLRLRRQLTMTFRTTQTVARFTSPFSCCRGCDAPQPAGEIPRWTRMEELIETSLPTMHGGASAPFV